MKSVRIILLTLVTVLAFADASAKTVSWAIPPKYEKLSRYTTDIFVFQQNGKWGMVTPGNVEILPASYEYITPFTNGYALAGVKEGSRYLLQAIISENGDVSTLDEKLYLPAGNQYFSEEKMLVTNRNGKFGYVNPSGQVIIKCQFDNALPFKEGWAPVKKGNYYKYINEAYDRNPSRNVLVVDFHYGEMTLASCFSNGRAVIAYNNDLALIDANGRKVRKIKEAEFKQINKSNNEAPKGSDGYPSVKNYVEFSENGMFGLKHGSDLIVTPQFTSFPCQYGDDYIVTEANGRQGLLRVNEGSYSFDMKSVSGSVSELEVDRDDAIEGVNLNISLPSVQKDLKLVVDCGNGIKQDVTSKLNVNGTTATLSVNPSPAANAENCVISAELANDGIIVAEASKEFTLSYPIKLRVSQPGQDIIQANASDIAVFSSTVYNDSNKPVEVTAKWSTGGTETRSIPAHSKSVFSSSIKVNENHTRTVSITLSTGESNSRSIYFKTFF